MVSNGKTFGARDVGLALFDLRVKKLFNPAAVQTDQMVMMLPFVQLINRLVAFKMAASQNVGLLKLRQHPINGGQRHIGVLLQQHPINVFGRHVPLRAALEDFQNLAPRHGHLQAGTLEVVNFGHVLARP